MNLGGTVFLVTYHPVTAGEHDTRREINNLIEALDSFPDATVIFTMPGADPEHQIVIDRINEAVAERPTHWHFVASLGQQKYLSLLALASAVVGNSSSGLLEAPTLRTPTVNIGTRQKGRLVSSTVVEAESTRASITDAIHRALSNEFQVLLADAVNPYGTGGAVDKIMRILEGADFSRLGPKVYHDQVSQTKVD
jgi:UDP-hydrolysing UDP-N-acetyl-D-glucosamine 2-epimerase